MSPVLPHSFSGTGDRVVLLVHGVGVDGSSYEELVSLLAEDATVVVPARRGYGEAANWAPAEALDDHVEDLLVLLDHLGVAQASYVGVSGGATLGLLCAARAPQRWSGLVLHEPLAGSHAPEIHARIRAGAAALAADPRPAAAVSYVEGLIGDTSWTALEGTSRERLALTAATIRREVAQFVELEPTAAMLAQASQARILVTVGESSPPDRHSAAREVAALVGGKVSVVSGAGHLPQLDSPTAFAELLAGQWDLVPS